jgi:hypothetical protein
MNMGLVLMGISLESIRREEESGKMARVIVGV